MNHECKWTKWKPLDATAWARVCKVGLHRQLIHQDKNPNKGNKK